MQDWLYKTYRDALGCQNEILTKEAIHLLVVLYIFLAGIIFLIVLLSAFLFIPLRYKLDAVWEQLPVELNFSLRNCGYGLKASWKRKNLNWHLLLFRWSLNPKKKDSANQQTHQATPQSNPAFPWNRLVKLAMDSSWRAAIWQQFEELWRTVRPRQMLIKARIGFDEPHYTGWMMGLAGILQRQNSSYRIDLEGVWDEPCMEGNIVISGEICLAILFWQLLKFLLQPNIRSSIKQLSRQARQAYSQAA